MAMSCSTSLVRAAIAVVLGAALAAPAVAQPRRNGPADAPAAGETAADPGSRRDRIKRKIRALRAYTLTDELALDERTAARLFPVMARYDDEIDKLLARRAELQRRLRHASTLGEPRAVDALVDDAIANQRAFWDLETRRLGELRKILSPTQTARLLVVLPALERRIQHQLRKAIVKRLPALDDDDDDQEPDETAPRPEHTTPPQRR